MNYELTKEDTFQLKGIAILLLLFHHLFYINNGLYNDWNIGPIPLIQTIGRFCKVCVAIFVFLSGYGLAISNSSSKKFVASSFYAKGFTKLYLNYWLIYILFVPIGILFFHRSFSDVYSCHVIPKAIIDFLGLADCFGYLGYNATWWFYSCILPLYLVFPVLRFLLPRFSIILILGAGLFMLKGPAILFLQPIKYYLLPFVLGMVFANKKILSISCRYSMLNNCILWSIFLLTAAFWRQFGFYLGGVSFDSVVVLGGVFVFVTIRKYICLKCKDVLAFLGKHSFNIFLFHTFIYYYYFPGIIYYTKNPLFIFFLLLLVCIIISIGIEKLKKILCFNHVQNSIIKYLVKSNTL